MKAYDATMKKKAEAAAAAREARAAKAAEREAAKREKEAAKCVRVEEEEESSDSSSRDPCISADSTLTVLADGRPIERHMRHVTAGDVVATGDPASPFRRVNRVWRSGSRGGTFEAEMFELGPRCRLTRGHPVLLKGGWKLPEALGIESARLQQDTLCIRVVRALEHTHGRTLTFAPYHRPTPSHLSDNLELEGHVDTVLVGAANGVGGVVCACVGRYCGEACYGWSVWTRKTMPCDEPGCTRCEVRFTSLHTFTSASLPFARCEIAVSPELDFASLDVMRPAVFHGPYEAY